jgi:hypothetical protein
VRLFDGKGRHLIRPAAIAVKATWTNEVCSARPAWTQRVASSMNIAATNIAATNIAATN